MAKKLPQDQSLIDSIRRDPARLLDQPDHIGKAKPDPDDPGYLDYLRNQSLGELNRDEQWLISDKMPKMDPDSGIYHGVCPICHRGTYEFVMHPKMGQVVKLQF